MHRGGQEQKKQPIKTCLTQELRQNMKGCKSSVAKIKLKRASPTERGTFAPKIAFT
jgi:hypothetical protein